jgi:hypothetical protein
MLGFAEAGELNPDRTNRSIERMNDDAPVGSRAPKIPTVAEPAPSFARGRNRDDAFSPSIVMVVSNAAERPRRLSRSWCAFAPCMRAG